MELESNSMIQKLSPSKHIMTDTKHEIEDAFQHLHLTFTSQELEMAHFEIERYKQQIQSYQKHIDIMEKDLKKKESVLSKVKMDCSLANAEKDVLKKEIVSLREWKVPNQECFYQFSPDQGDDSKLVKPKNLPMNDVGVLDSWNDYNVLYRGIEKELHELSLSLEKNAKRRPIYVITNGLKLINRCVWFCSFRKTSKMKALGACKRFKWPWHQTRFKYERIHDECDSMTVLSDGANPFENHEVVHKSTLLRNLMNEFHSFDKNQRRYIKSLQDCVGVQQRTISGLQNEIARLVSLHITHSFPVSIMEGSDELYNNYEVVLNGEEEKMELSSF